MARSGSLPRVGTFAGPNVRSGHGRTCELVVLNVPTRGCGFARYLTDLLAGRADRDTEFPMVPPDEAAQTYDADLARLLTTLRDTVFVITGIAAGMVPPAQATLVLQITDTGTRRAEHLPDPGPATTLRGTASDLMLALWRRRDPLAFHVDGPREMLERWPAF